MIGETGRVSPWASDGALSYMRRAVDAGYVYGPGNRAMIVEANDRALVALRRVEHPLTLMTSRADLLTDGAGNTVVAWEIGRARS